MKVTTKGQVTIPRHIRQYLGITPYSEVDFTIRDDEVVLVKTDGDGHETKRGRFGRLRGSKKGRLTTDAWMKATRGE